MASPLAPTWYPWQPAQGIGLSNEGLSAARWNQLLDLTYYQFEQRMGWVCQITGSNNTVATLPAGPAWTLVPLRWICESGGIIAPDDVQRYPATWTELFGGRTWPRGGGTVSPNGSYLTIPYHPSNTARTVRERLWTGREVTLSTGHFCGPYLMGVSVRFTGTAAAEEGTIGVEIVARDNDSDEWKPLMRRYDELDGTDNFYLNGSTMAIMPEGRRIGVRLYSSAADGGATQYGPSETLDCRDRGMPSAYSNDVSRASGIFWGFQLSGWSEPGALTTALGGD